MGQKVNPIGFRLQVRRDWSSSWYVNGRNYNKALFLDFEIRKLIKGFYPNAIVSKVLINRTNCDEALTGIDYNSLLLANHCENAQKIKNTGIFGGVKIIIHAQNSNSVFTKNPKALGDLKDKIKKIGLFDDVKIDFVDVRRPDIDAACVALNIAAQIKKRISHKKAAKRALDSAMRFDNCMGIKIILAGRLGGAEMAKVEVFKSGSVPLHTLSANVLYGFAESFTTYGVIGVKVYIYLV
jgi:small subunit ribosomal protein S3